MWEPYKRGYKAWLQLEKSLSDNSVQAYLHDIEKLTEYFLAINDLKTPSAVQLKDLENFVRWIHKLGITASSQLGRHFITPRTSDTSRCPPRRQSIRSPSQAPCSRPTWTATTASRRWPAGSAWRSPCHSW